MTNAIQNENLKVKYVAMAILVLRGADCMEHKYIHQDSSVHLFCWRSDMHRSCQIFIIKLTA